MPPSPQRQHEGELKQDRLFPNPGQRKPEQHTRADAADGGHQLAGPEILDGLGRPGLA